MTDRVYFVGSEGLTGVRPEDAPDLEGPFHTLTPAIAVWQADADSADALAVYACEPRGRLEPAPPEELRLLAHLVADWVDVDERLPREGERIRFVTGGMPPREHEGWYDATDRYFCERDERSVVHRWRTQVVRWQLVVEEPSSRDIEPPLAAADRRVGRID